MCGIVGVFSKRTLGSETARVMEAMAGVLAHRGPDDSGVWLDADKGIAFGHRRLAVIDLSSEGHQPMMSESGRYVINFNGEIYNYSELHDELMAKGHRFRGHSDTEVLLAAFEEWGLERALRNCTGMFALALWDLENQVLFLARDRMGEKPLYYGVRGDCLLFASELKAFHEFPGWSPEINRDALTLLLRHGFISAPHTIYLGFHKLIPGTFLKLSRETMDASPTYYWSPVAVAEAAAANPFPGSETEAIEELDRILKKAIAGQMLADVPLGAFLSGGIDSSTVVALMQCQSTQPVRTFTIGFREPEFNEADAAAAVAKHLGTNHTELYVDPQEALSLVSRLPEMYDEPFADSSQIPTFLISRMTRQHVTVSLSGDGGDELFGGYNRYFRGYQLWKKTRWLPGRARKAGAGAIRTISPEKWNSILQPFRDILPPGIRDGSYGSKAYKVAEILENSSFSLFYRSLMSHWQNPSSIVLGSTEPDPWLTFDQQSEKQELFERMMFLDAIRYLPDDILVKLDRASMAVSLETRVPMLDHHVVEFAWRLPLSMKIRRGTGKWILRQVLKKYVPTNLVDRPKQGFGVPIGTWLGGPLRKWAEDLLSEERLKRDGFFNPDPIRQKWKEQLSGKRDVQALLWNVLMFQSWLSCRN